MDFNKQNILTNKQNFINPENLKTMKNLILTICLSVAVSFSFAQIDVVGPDGDVGVGVTNPTEKLDISGNLKIRGNFATIGSAAGSAWTSLRIGEGRSGNGASYFDLVPRSDETFGIRFVSFDYGVGSLAHAGSSQLVLRTDKPNAPLWFRTGGNSTNRLVVAANGNVGINTNSPGVKFEVQGWAAKPGGGEWAAASDKKLKNDISDFNLGLNEILKLNPIYFKYNGDAGIKDTKTTHVGLIAQDFEKVAPYAVKKLQYQEIINEGDDKAFKIGETMDYLAIDGSSIKYMLVNAIKEQQQLIENQNKIISELQSTVGKLSEKVNNGINSNTDLLIDLVGNKNVAKLFQNTPNPLTNATTINIFIPENVKSADLKIQDLNGKLIEKVNIDDRGIQTLNIRLSDFASGLYTYTLETDGKIVDTKKMIIK